MQRLGHAIKVGSAIVVAVAPVWSAVKLLQRPALPTRRRTKTNGVGHSQLQGKKRTFNLNFVHLLALLIGKCVILQAILNSNKN